MSPSGKARDFDSRIRRFKSGHPSQHKGHASACPLCWVKWAVNGPVQSAREPSPCTRIERFAELDAKRTILFNIQPSQPTQRARFGVPFVLAGIRLCRAFALAQMRRCTFAARRSGSSLTRRRASESRSEAELPVMSPHNTKTVDRFEPAKCIF